MAAPHVTGAAGLLFSLKPSATVTAVKNALLSSVDPDPALLGKTTSGGRLNVAGALYALMPPAGEQPPDTEITAGPSGATQSSEATFQFHRSDSTAATTFECRLMGESGWTSCTSPKVYAVDLGVHVFEVRANSGPQVDPIPASRSWTAEPAPIEPPLPPPSIPIIPSTPPPPTVSPPAVTCIVPTLAGKSLAQAKAALVAAHCTLGIVTKPKAKKGRKLAPLVVKSSTPSAGAKPASGKVDLKLAPKLKPKKHHH